MRFIAPFATLLGYTAAMPSIAMRESKPPLDQIRILDMQAKGTGCPTQADYSVMINSDGTIIQFTYNKLVAESKEGLSPTANRKFCQHSFRLLVPNGYRFTVLNADYRGYVSLPANASAALTSTYYFSGDAATATLSRDFIGPIKGDNYQKSDALGMATTVWSPCGTETMLQLKNAVSVTPTGFKEEALMTVDSGDLKVTQTFGMRYEPCPKKPGNWTRTW